MNIMEVICGLSLVGDDYSFVGIAREGETPYDYSTRLLADGYPRVATVPLWRLYQYPKAWQQFLAHNQEVKL